jgi:16S rRNA (guanine966-N2)-methyltransferase
MRVAGGELRGRRLTVPRRRSRPTTERVREAIFSILGPIEDARVLDLFCGSGALGIEALSRGAARATLVDIDTRAARRNVAELGLDERAEVARANAARFLRTAEPGAYDLIFCDPPYRLADRLAAQLGPLLRAATAERGRVILETSSDNPLELDMPLALERDYGDTLIRVHSAGEER